MDQPGNPYGFDPNNPTGFGTGTTSPGSDPGNPFGAFAGPNSNLTPSSSNGMAVSFPQLSAIGNWIERALIIFVAIGIIVVGLWMFGSQSQAAAIGRAISGAGRATGRAVDGATAPRAGTQRV